MKRTTAQISDMFFGRNMSRPAIQKTLERRVIGGIEYQVYPCIMLVEGVHHGIDSDPVYYPQQVLEASAPNWNNMPVTMGHPVQDDGTHIMCNHDGTVRHQWQVGYVTNARYEDEKLKADLYLSVALVNDKSPELFAFIENGGQLEVSTGMMAAENGIEGVWNEEKYNGVIQTIIPDHLALLPNSTGACSWDDGCGLRANEGKEKIVVIMGDVNLEDIAQQVYRYIDSLDTFENTNNERRYLKLNMVRAIYSKYFIYKESDRTDPQAEQSKMLKQNYKVDSDGAIVMEGDPVEVIEEIKYKPKTNEVINKQQTPQKENSMKRKTNCKKGVKCNQEEMVLSLIQNEKSVFTEDDQETLMAMALPILEKVFTNSLEEEEPVVVKDPEKKEVVINDGATTLESYLKDAPNEIRSLLNAGLRELDNKRSTLIGKIIANEQNKFTEDALKAMDIATLENVVSLIPVVEPEPGPSFFGASPAAPIANEGEGGEAPYIPVTLSDSLGTKKK